jgi:hypothetical protein
MSTAPIGPVPKEPPFSWSYSKLKNFRICPKRHFHYDIAKDVKQEKDEKLQYGDDVHAALHKRISKNVPLPHAIMEFEPLVMEFLKGTPDPSITILTEQKFAIDAGLQPLLKLDGTCDYFSKRVWFRAIADAVKIKQLNPEQSVAVNWDWKTGKVKEDPLQILTAACCLFAFYPTLQVVRNEFIWLEYGQRSRCDLRRENMAQVWASVMPEVEQMKEAQKQSYFPPKPGFLCESYCEVKTCPHYGERP